MSQRNKDRFLQAYSRLGNCTAAAEAVGISRRSHDRWLQGEAYRKRFEEAEEQAIEVLEQEALRRATEGRDEPVWFNGQIVGHVKKPSDVLLIFLLKSKRPDVYRERYDARLTANLNVQSAVKVVHEYHDQGSTIDAQFQTEPTEPNKRIMGAIEAGAVPVPVPVPEGTLSGTAPMSTPTVDVPLPVPAADMTGVTPTTTVTVALPPRYVSPLPVDPAVSDSGEDGSDS